MTRPVILFLTILAFASGCQTSSKFNSWKFWRPQDSTASTVPPVDPYVPAATESEQVILPAPSRPLPLTETSEIPPAPSFSEPRPTAAPNLFPMQ